MNEFNTSSIRGTMVLMLRALSVVMLTCSQLHIFLTNQEKQITMCTSMTLSARSMTYLTWFFSRFG